AGQGMTLASADAGSSIFLQAGGAASVGTLDAGTSIDVIAASMTIAGAVAGDDVTLDSGGNIDLGSAQAGDDFRADAGGAFAATQVTATGGGFDDEAGYGSALGEGSNILIQAQDNLQLGSAAAAGAVNLASLGGHILSSGLIKAGAGLNATADQNIAIADARAGEDLLAIAGGDFTAGTLRAGGALQVSAGGGAVIDAANSGDALSVDAGGNVQAGLLNGRAGVTVVADGAIAVQAGFSNGSIGFEAGAGIDAGTLAARGSIELAAGNEAAVASAQAGDAIFLSAGTAIDAGSLDSGSSITAQSGSSMSIDTARADGAINLDAGGDIAAGSLTSDDAIFASADGAIAVTTAVSAGGIALDGEGDVRLDDGTADGEIELTSRDGDVLSGGRLTAAALRGEAAGDFALNDVFVAADLVLATPNGAISGNSFNSDGGISLDASGSVVLASADAGEDIGVRGGSIDLGSASAGGDIDLRSVADLAVGAAQAGGSFTAEAGGNGLFGAVAADKVEVDTGGQAAFQGAVQAGTISVVSGDIEIGESGALGDAGTELVSLTARATGQPVVVGGGEEGPGYTLTQAEAGRIAAERLRIQAPQTANAGNSPSVFVRDLAFDAGRVGAVELQSGGIVEVQGNLLLANAGASNTLEIRAGSRLQLITPTGSIRVRDSAGLPAGSVSLTASDIWAGSRTIIDQLSADPDFAGRDAALLANDGPVEPRGYIEGADVSLFAADTVFVQNSGTRAEFGGITVLADTLTITPTGSDPLVVFAFGSRLNPDGSSVTNVDFFREVAFAQGSAGYTDESQFNLCFINSGICSGGPETPDGRDPITEPFNIVSPEDPDDLDTSFADEPLIEEPVTSGTDSIFWECGGDDQDQGEEQDRRCQRDPAND
ncbi:MAG TPA: hypothetical protein VGX37_09620, partial [Allosphingosinicella sp.]|nr:hypothetical protein [Allosphingosinicella sp.]